MTTYASARSQNSAEAGAKVATRDMANSKRALRRLEVDIDDLDNAVGTLRQEILVGALVTKSQMESLQK